MTMTWEIFAAIMTVVIALGGVAVKWITGAIAASEKTRDEASKRIEAHQKDMKDDLATIKGDTDKRLDRIEQRHAEFMPRAEIKASLEHEKNGRASLNESMMRFYERNANDIVQVRVEIGKLQSEHSNIAASVNEIKTSLKEQRHETNERLDMIIREVRETKPRS